MSNEIYFYVGEKARARRARAFGEDARDAEDARGACLRRVAFWEKAPQKLLMLWVLTAVR